MSAGTCTADGSSLTFRIRRYYDPATGQFISVDPAVDQTEAPYAYVSGDPVDGIDPLGLGCFLSVCTHSFDPMASLDAWINIGRGATYGLTDRIANWIVPGASCTVAQDSLDQFIGGSATMLLGGEAIGALLRSGRFGELLARIRAVELADETGSLGRGGLSPNQMNQAILRGQAPRGFIRVDSPRIPGEQYNIHFDDGRSALNIDGTWKHGGLVLTRAQAEWLTENGWVVP